MSGDIVKRLQSARRWLEKAEHSFNRHEEVSGELNLIMAQAEMQRLKETRSGFFAQHQRSLKWSAAVAALCLFAGVSSLWHEASSEVLAPEAYVPAAVHPAAVRSLDTAPASVPQPAVPQASIPQDAPAASEGMPSPEFSVNTVSENMGQTSADTGEKAAPSYEESHSEAPAVPVMSQQEIQSVVGDAGRALRGRS